MSKKYFLIRDVQKFILGEACNLIRPNILFSFDKQAKKIHAGNRAMLAYLMLKEKRKRINENKNCDLDMGESLLGYNKQSESKTGNIIQRSL